MKNCIKTVYPFSMENDNAPIFGRLNLHMYNDVTVTDPTQLRVAFVGKGVKISVDSPNYFVIGGTADPSVDSVHYNEYTIPDSEHHYLAFSQGDYDIHIDEMYNLGLLACMAGADDKPCAIGMNLDDAAYLTNLKGLRWIFDANKTTGSINSLGRLVHLCEGYSTATPNKYYVLSFNSEQVTGSIESFVEGQVENGRYSTGSYPIKTFNTLNASGNSKVTFGNSRLSSLIGNVFAALWITWENANKIAIYKGNSTAVSTNVYVRGYSSSEIATNQGSGGIWEGKIVTDVVSGTVYPSA